MKTNVRKIVALVFNRAMSVIGRPGNVYMGVYLNTEEICVSHVTHVTTWAKYVTVKLVHACTDVLQNTGEINASRAVRTAKKMWIFAIMKLENVTMGVKMVFSSEIVASLVLHRARADVIKLVYIYFSTFLMVLNDCEMKIQFM